MDEQKNHAGRHHPEPDEAPDTDELQEPSTEKEPDELPTAPADDEEPDHEAIGVGVIGYDPEEEPTTI